jgi:hypothetical protein
MTRYGITAIAAVLALAGPAVAAPPADQVARLGKDLTPWGAEVAGNKEGTIPPYEGGLRNGPKFDYGAKVMLPDPFAGEKPLFTINAANADQYADKLSAGTVAMLKKLPGFRLLVYPSHRTAAYPKEFLDNSVRNATTCSTADKGNTLVASKDCRAGMAFPIPQDGYEAIWNKAAGAWIGAGGYQAEQDNIYVKSDGEMVRTSFGITRSTNGFYDKASKVPTLASVGRTEYSAPARIAGQASLIVDSLRDGGRLAYSYQPATRRVRLAPDFAADAPNPTYGGVVLYDELIFFFGTMDRWDMKLMGKREMYIPVNTYKVNAIEECKGKNLYSKLYPNPECFRWELRRVWHVQGTIKSGRRNVQPKRDFFFDEDTWYTGIMDGYDRENKLWHVEWAAGRPDWVKLNPNHATDYWYFDMQTGIYVVQARIISRSMDAANVPQLAASENLGTPTLRF